MEFKEFRDFKEWHQPKTLNSLTSLNSLISLIKSHRLLTFTNYSLLITNYYLSPLRPLYFLAGRLFATRTIFRLFQATATLWG